MATKTEIMNLALDLLGEPAIVNETDAVRSARVMSLLWDSTRRAVLADHVWTFARKRAQPAKLGTAPLFGYDAAYQLPSDFVRVVATNVVNFTIEGSAMLTSEGQPNLIYVYDHTDPSNYPAPFVKALAAALARDGCIGVTRKLELLGDMEAKYLNALNAAKAIDSQQVPAPEIDASSFLDARWGGVTDPFRPFGSVEENL